MKRFTVCLIGLLLTTSGFFPGLAANEMQQLPADLTGRWVSYHWDGERAPVRLELEIEVLANRRFSAVLRRPGNTALAFSGVLREPGVAESAGGIRIELASPGQSRVEFSRNSSYSTALSFFRE